METEELTRAMRDATADLRTKAGFAPQVIKGARRRRLRNRAAIAGVATVAAAVVGTGTMAAFPALFGPDSSTQNTQVAASRAMLTEPTRGDLASDLNFIDQALTAWNDGVRKSPNGLATEVTGDPHVYWAGDTPAGRVALVVQATEESTAMGLIAGEEPTLVNEMPRLDVSPARSQVFLFGAGDRYAIAPAGKDPLLISPRWELNPDGTGQRDWEPMEALDDVVAFAELPEGNPPEGVRVGREGIQDAKTSRAAHELSRVTLPGTLYLEGWERQGKIYVETRLPWHRDLSFRIDGAKLRPQEDRDHLFDAAERAEMQDPLLDTWLSGFEVVADLQDGRHVEAFELQPFVGAPTGFYALVTGPDWTFDQLVYGGVMNPEALLPARVELPDEQGWIVAHYQAKLRYSTSSADGPWHDAGKDAALLPHDTEAVEVTLPGEEPEVVFLNK